MKKILERKGLSEFYSGHAGGVLVYPMKILKLGPNYFNNDITQALGSTLVFTIMRQYCLAEHLKEALQNK